MDSLYLALNGIAVGSWWYGDILFLVSVQVMHVKVGFKRDDVLIPISPTDASHNGVKEPRQANSILR